MRKICVFISLILICVFGIAQQHAANEHIHNNAKSAITILHQSKASLPSDSLLFQNELQRVRTEYKTFADSLKSYCTATEYAAFENQRLINLCYAAPGLQEFKKEQNKLFEHLATYHTHIPNQDSINEEIAKCLVNSYESQSIWFEDSLLNHVTSAMDQHMQSVQSWTWLPAQKQAFVDMYASQYYKRGIISMAEPVFRHFREIFSQQKKTETTAPEWSEDYPVLSAKLAPTGKKLSDLNEQKIGIIASEESPFHLIYLIVQIRRSAEAYPETQICVFRKPEKVSDNYLSHALKRNLAIDDYFIVDLNETDSKTVAQYPCCYYQTDDKDIRFSTNNPIDFLQWLENPLSEQIKRKNEQLHDNYKKIQARKDSIADLPPDNSLQYNITDNNLSVNFNGYWNIKPEIKTKTHYFTKSAYNPISDSVKMLTLEVFIQQHPVYTLSFFPAENQTKISLTADPTHYIKANFDDQRNQQWYRALKTQDSLLYRDNIYANLIGKYPFSKSVFLDEITQRRKKIHQKIQHVQNREDKASQALLQIRHNINQLSSNKHITAMSHADISTYYPVQQFDSVIWESPYYKAWLDAWLTYNREDLQNAIDMLYRTWQIVPNTANTLMSEYIWNKMNSMGRFDVMVHLDTTYLIGCSDIKDIDIMKRVEGYKRMAPGKKAPNFTWQENGTQMDIYSIDADTTLVVFWSDKCSHCVKKLPIMYEALSDKEHISVVAVAVDSDDSSLQIGKKHMSAWHHVWAKEGWKDSIIELYNIFGTPEMYVLDNDHMIISKQLNYP